MNLFLVDLVVFVIKLIHLLLPLLRVSTVSASHLSSNYAIFPCLPSSYFLLVYSSLMPTFPPRLYAFMPPIYA